MENYGLIEKIFSTGLAMESGQHLDNYTKLDKKYKHLSQTSLDMMGHVAEAASKYVRERQEPEAKGNVMVHSRKITEEQTTNIFKATRTLISAAQKVMMEPILVKTVIRMEETGELREFYTCKERPQGLGQHNVISRDGPWGHISTLEAGYKGIFDEDEFERLYPFLKNDADKPFTVIQQVKFNHHYYDNNSWDCRSTEYTDTIKISPVTLSSLKIFLQKQQSPESLVSDDISKEMVGINLSTQDAIHVPASSPILMDALASLMKQEQEQELQDNIREGRFRDTVDALNLRAQHTLDREQSSIFRMGLCNSILLLGPAGSGKTTTLIHRLRQKLDRQQGLTDQENKLITEARGVNHRHEDSWIVFTPTKLLGLCLKNAFNKEGVLAPDERIQTWEEYQIEIGRRLKFLKKSTDHAGMVRNLKAQNLLDPVHDRIDLYYDFQKWMCEQYFASIQKSIEDVLDHINDEDEKEFDIFVDITDKMNKYRKRGGVVDFLSYVVECKEQIRASVKRVNTELTAIVNANLERLLSEDDKFTNEFNKFYIENIKNNESKSEQEGSSESDELITEEEKIKLIKAYKIAIVSYANREKLVGKKKDLIEWLGHNRLPMESELIKLRKLRVLANSLSRFNDPVKSYFSSFVKNYIEFRSLKQKQQKWYVQNRIYDLDINELDILILYDLQTASDMMSRSIIWKNIDSEQWLSELKNRIEEFFNQVFVDEALDFSPIQLKCMRLLAHPMISSFFACGDFFQRINIGGTHSIEVLNRLFKGGLQKHEINISYRQNEQLFDFSQALLGRLEGRGESATSSQSYFANKGFSPVLKENINGKSLTEWLADRICEIETEMKGHIPSIGILVPEESYVTPVASDLDESLKRSGTTVIVQACHNGEIKGNESAVRVFAIGHVKGLEFEAAFFVAFDRVAEQTPELSDNFLYVGATRAANFLALTCEAKLPSNLKDLRPFFKESWV